MYNRQVRAIAHCLMFLAAGAFGQTVAPSAFEVASIRPAVFPSDGYFRGFSASGTCTVGRFKISGNRVTFSRVTLCGLIMSAYDIPSGQGYRVTGAPNWMMKPDQSVYYDIDARVEGDRVPSSDQVPAMLRTLLADRFRLRLHRGTKEMAVYALVAGKNGPKLSSEAICNKPTFDPNGRTFGMTFCKPTESMVQFAREIADRSDRPVLDMTGIAGQFAFSVTWIPDRGDGPRCSPTQEGCFNEPVRPDLEFFSAIQEQLGLKVEARKAQVDVLVIDQAERPTAN